MEPFKTSQSGIDIAVESAEEIGAGLVLSLRDNRNGKWGKYYELTFTKLGKVEDVKFWEPNGHCEGVLVKEFRAEYGALIDPLIPKHLKSGGLSGMYQGEEGIQRIVVDGPIIRLERCYL